MATLFGSNTTQDSSTTPPVSSLRIQTSVEGKPRAIIYGKTRVSGNLIWYGDFYSIVVQTSSGAAAGGKGGLFATPSSGGGSAYNYFTSVEIALAEGDLGEIGPRMWASKAVTTLQESGLGGIPGSGTQMPWGYLSAEHPDQALAYRYTGLIAGNVALGTNTELPNWTFEVTSAFANGAPGIPDARATDMIADYLANPRYGVPGWSYAYNADWTDAANYTVALGLLVSVALTEQVTANSWLADVIESLNLWATWSDSQLKLIPLGDELVSGNGVAYFPPTAPEYDLADEDFLPNQSSFGGTNGDPVSCQIVPPRDQNNVVKVEFIDRDSEYNPASVRASDDASILLYGERGSDGTKSWHWLQTLTAANMAAELALGRQQTVNRYAFTLRPRFILLDVGDIVTITDEDLGLFRQWVRIEDIQENGDRSLSFQVLEVLQGTGAAPLYGREITDGYKPDYNADPGATNPPLIFEPTDQLAGGLEVWAAVSGVDETLYGGCDVWASYDGVNFSFIQRAYGSARMGVTTAVLPSYPANPTGQTIDSGNAVFVDLSESDADLMSATELDATSLNTACYVDGEYLSYATATLTGPHAYSLTYLVRGIYGTEEKISAHPAGSPFARIDSAIVQVPYDATRVGATIYLKFVPFNVWGGGLKSLADVPAYTYTITGYALATPLPDVIDLRTAFTDGFLELSWTEVSDFRSPIFYRIRKGETWEAAQDVGVVAHPPFKLLGNGTYWVSARCEPAPGLTVYSEDPTSINIAGNMLTSSIVFRSDQQAEGWLGTFDQTATEGTNPNAILRLVGTSILDQDVLALPDVLNFGGVVPSGSYEIPAADIIDVGYEANLYLEATWTITGAPVGQDVLGNPDILNTPDILGAASTRFIDGWVEVATRHVGNPDLYEDGDLYGAGDLYRPYTPWGDWQRYVPGVYRCASAKLRIVLTTIDNQTIAFALAFSFTGSVAPRIDHYQQMSVPAGGVTVIFQPDDGLLAAPFNGGPLLGPANNHPLPFVSIAWAGQPGDAFVVDSLSLTQLVFHIIDSSGTPASRSGVNVIVEGY